MNEEILLIDKPGGITSFDVIRKLRVSLGIKKMGHAGTLDPLATGLLIIAVGKATKKINDHPFYGEWNLGNNLMEIWE